MSLYSMYITYELSPSTFQETSTSIEQDNSDTNARFII